MGHRTVKRVPLNFRAPLDQTWEGYINPHISKAKECPACDGSGASPDMQFLSDSWYRHKAREMYGNFYGDNIHSLWTPERYRQAGWSEKVIENIGRAKKFGFTTLTHWSDKLHQEEVDALIEGLRLTWISHDWNEKAKKWIKKESFKAPTPDELAAMYAGGMGHDSINQWICVKTRAKRYGLNPDDKKQSECPKCEGKGCIWPSKSDENVYDAWTPTEPPTGQGWQLWQTVSEGGPVSPVFKTPGELATWCEKNATIFADEKLSKEQWLRLIREENVDVGSCLIGDDNKLASLAKHEMGEPSPRDWMPDEKEK